MHASSFASPPPALAPGTHRSLEINVIEYRHARVSSQAYLVQREQVVIRRGIRQTLGCLPMKAASVTSGTHGRAPSNRPSICPSDWFWSEGNITLVGQRRPPW